MFAVVERLHIVPQSARSCHVNACKSSYLQLWGTTHNSKVSSIRASRVPAAHFLCLGHAPNISAFGMRQARGLRR